MVTGPLLSYNEPQLVGKLTKLPLVARALFAAACAERLLPMYAWSCHRTGRGDPKALERALTALWAHLENNGSEALEPHREIAEELVPDEDDSWVDECAYAQHAAAAVAYAIRSWLTAEPKEAGWAARQSYELLDLWVTTRDNIDLNAPGAEDRVVSDYLIQAELQRQHRDLKELDLAAENVRPMVQQLRRRARAEGAQLLDISL